MPSLRKRVSSYFRQLSFYNEPREKKHNVNENSFVTKYLEGHISIKEGPPILYGKNPTDLPNYDLGVYEMGPNTTIGCYSGPNGGLTTVKRLEKHLSIPDTDIDFIDTQDEPEADNTSTTSDAPNTVDPTLPEEWNRKSDYIYGISDSLYDKNQVTKSKNGDPIADCFGIIARNDSAILAVADGVNWGERASIAAKSAVHGCLHYLNQTIFNDTKPFDDLCTKSDQSQKSSAIFSQNRISNTREVFVCLLRAFNCAHDLILENDGMLTTLTVAVVLPLKPKNVKAPSKLKTGVDTLNRDKPRRPQQTDRPRGGPKGDDGTESYVCCVCNVGDTLAYVYSQKYGVRELTKGSHDVNCNRDMRDALGALGPVEGIKPELGNLTLAVTVIQKGDIIMVASDGLTDNFDPNVCKFTVNSKEATTRLKRPSTSRNTHHNKENIEAEVKPSSSHEAPETASKPSDEANKLSDGASTETSEGTETKVPVKPPRKNKDNLSRSSRERSVDSFEGNLESQDSSSQLDQKTNDAVPGTENSTEKTTAHHHSDASRSSAKAHRSSSLESSRKKSSTSNPADDCDNPLVAQFLRENSLDSEKPKKRSSLESQKVSVSKTQKSHTKTPPQTLPNQPKVHIHKTASRNIPLNKPMEQRAIDLKRSSSKAKEVQPGNNKTGFMRSKTSLDMRTSAKIILRNEDGVPFVTPMQRYEISLLLMEDVLRHGISGHDSQCAVAKKVCENLVNFTFSITSAKRRTLEDADLYFDNANGVLVEVSQQEKKMRRKKGMERVQNLPGKLDHVSVVAYNVGNFAFTY